MADVIIKLKVMPINPEVDLKALTDFCKEKIKAAGAHLHKAEEEPVAFGLKALVFIFMGPEAKIKTDKIEDAIKENSDVSSAEVIDVRRAVDL